MRLLIPFPAGGSTEFTALTLAGPMGRLLGEPVVVEARVGDAGIVALRELAHAAAPTLMVGSVNTNSIAPVVFAERIDFDYDAAVRPVARLVEFPSVAVTRRAVPTETLPAFVAHARRQWGRIRNGTDWIGSYPDIDAARLGRAAGIEVVNLTRDGGALALLDALVADEVDLLFLNVRTASMGIDAGTIRPLAVTGPRGSTAGRTSRPWPRAASPASGSRTGTGSSRRPVWRRTPCGRCTTPRSTRWARPPCATPSATPAHGSPRAPPPRSSPRTCARRWRSGAPCAPRSAWRQARDLAAAAVEQATDKGKAVRTLPCVVVSCTIHLLRGIARSLG